MPQGYADPFSNLRAGNDAPAAAEPETWWGGFSKGLGDYATDVGQGMMQSMAQPQTAGDFLGLMLPGVVGSGAALTRGAGAGRTAAAAAAGAPTAEMKLRQMLHEVNTGTGRFGGERTTGHWAEGPGGLRDTAAGKLKRYPMPVSKPTAPVAAEAAPANSMSAFGAPVTEPAITRSADPTGALAEADAKLQRQGAVSRLDPRDQGAGTLGDKPLPPGGTFKSGTPIRMRLDEIPPEIRNQAPGTKLTDTETGIMYIRDKTGKLFIDRSKAKAPPPQ